MSNVKFEYNGKLSDGRFFDDDSKKKVVVENIRRNTRAERLKCRSPYRDSLL